MARVSVRAVLVAALWSSLVFFVRAAADPHRNVATVSGGYRRGLLEEVRAAEPATTTAVVYEAIKAGPSSGGGGGGGDGSGGGASTAEGTAKIVSVGAGAVGAESPSMAGPGIVVRRDLLVECTVGYFGDSCDRCTTGFVESENGSVCVAPPPQCTPGNGFRAFFFMSVTLLTVLFTLDALWNGRSPPTRVAQLLPSVSRGMGRTAGWPEVGTADADFPPDSLSQSREDSSKGLALSGSGHSSTAVVAVARGGRASSDCGCWGRQGLGRVLQGAMIFVATAQIMTQGSKLLELEFPLAMQGVLATLQWTNLDPQSIFGSCILPQRPFLDRVDGAIGFFSACLVALVLSYAWITLRRRTPKHDANESSIAVSSRSWPGAGLQQQQQQQQQQNAPVSSTKMERVCVRGGETWERWDRWSSAERHVCAAVVVCLLMYPMVCTTLLRVFDCSRADGTEGRWLRADTNVECSSGQHDSYKALAVFFLVVYGLGVPVALVAITFWAKGGDADDVADAAAATGGGGGGDGLTTFPDDDDDDSGSDTTAVAVERLKAGRGRGHSNGEGVKADSDNAKVQVLVRSEKSSLTTLPRGDWEEVEGGGTKGNRIDNGGCGGDGCGWIQKSKPWRTSGQWVLAVRKTMPPAPDLCEWSKANKRWRSTIPLWSPYRDDRQWFAAWELGRRLVLTGFLIAVPPDGEGNEHIRAVVAFVLAGVALVVGEVARPHRDPWIYWIYRAGGFIILLMTLAGLLQKVGSSRSNAVLVGILIPLLLAMVVCVCGGWRLSCAEQESRASASAVGIFPRSTGSVTPSRVFPHPGSKGLRDLSAGLASRIRDGVNVSAAVDAARKEDIEAPHRPDPQSSDRGDNNPVQAPDTAVGRSGGSSGTGEDSSASDRGGGDHQWTAADRGTVKRSPAYQVFDDCDGRRSFTAASETSKLPHREQKSLRNSASIHMMNPMYINDSSSVSEKGEPGRRVDALDGGSSNGLSKDRASSGVRRHRPASRDCHLYSRPLARSGGPGSTDGSATGSSGRGELVRLSSGVFSSVSGPGSLSMKSSIDSHLMSVGGRVYSHPEAVAIPAAASPDGRPAVFSGGDSIGRPEAATGAPGLVPAKPRPTAAVPILTRPVLAPGAPMIDRHKRRHGERKAVKRSSSSFASTSFESADGVDRSRRSDRVLALTNSRKGIVRRGSSPAARSQMRRLASFGGGSDGGDGLASVSDAGTGTGPWPGVSGGNGRVRRSLLKSDSTGTSEEFLSQGSSSVASWLSPTPSLGASSSHGAHFRFPSVARSSREIDVDMFGSGSFPAAAEGPDSRVPIVGDSSNLGSNRAPTQTPRQGWPLDRSASTATSSQRDSQYDLALGVRPDLALAAANRALAAEQEEAAFAAENGINGERLSGANGGRNMVDIRTFVRAGESRTSSFDLRNPDERVRGGSSSRDDNPSDTGGGGGIIGGGTDAEGKQDDGGGNGGRICLTRSMKRGENGEKPLVRYASSSSPRIVVTPLTSAQLEKHLNHDFEDEDVSEIKGGLDTFVRMSQGVNMINGDIV